MSGRDWITEEEFETAARFLQVVATMRGNLGDYYSELLDEERRWNSDMRGEDYRRIENWLNDIIPNFRYLDAEQPSGATVEWDGKCLLVCDGGRVLATFDPAELRDPRSVCSRGEPRGAAVAAGKTERLQELRGTGALGRVLYLISSRDNERRAEDVKEARKLVLGVLQEAGIRVDAISRDGALNEDHIVWGVYSEPCKAIERQEALENQRVTSLSVPGVRSWFRKPKPEKKEIAKPEKTEPETEPESERRIRWDWWLVMVELIILGGIAYIWSTQGRDHPALVPLCSLGVLVAISGLSVLAALEWEDSDE